VLFGLIKAKLKRRYKENSKRNLVLVVSEVLQEFRQFDMTHVFRKCGYAPTGFNPGTAYDSIEELEYDQ
jgi:hypothetical protein